MGMTDPLSDMITRIRNGQAASKEEVRMHSSNLKVALCRVLENEGYIESFNIKESLGKSELTIRLKYYKGLPVIENIQRVSKPGCRVYKTKAHLPNVLGGLGVAVISTSKGLMTGTDAKKQGHGGEVICIVS
ncbi:small subunit ribosomal protein S8 [Methylomagnum ishizawai]|uniref:Small ribosomal subunit protein uS8 n=1 Tax=Methylomagnum ishizawai TaxID=1760988 RepID=A0A1Y6D8L4_9GAMM|nr:30S ribosomal protein S8 [Methylomagnum ishizawai]SMF96762.1 small subunit ribosomal protein S8 [Methylomagnum ishizawai]